MFQYLRERCHLRDCIYGKDAKDALGFCSVKHEKTMHPAPKMSSSLVSPGSWPWRAIKTGVWLKWDRGAGAYDPEGLAWHPVPVNFFFFFQLPSCTEMEKQPGVILLSPKDHVQVSNSSGEFIYFKIPWLYHRRIHTPTDNRWQVPGGVSKWGGQFLTEPQ